MAQEYSRIIHKRSTTAGVVPTVPSVDDLNTFNGTDIFIGELFWNAADHKLYTRSLSGITQLTGLGNPYTSFVQFNFNPLGIASPVNTLGPTDAFFHSPYDFEITDFAVSVWSPQNGGNTLKFDLVINGVSALSSLAEINNGQKTTQLGSPPVFSTTTVSTADELYFKLADVGTGDALGLSITLTGYRT